MSKQFCPKCWDDTECTYKERMKKETIDGIEIEYLEKYYTCDKCGEYILGDMYDYNVIEGHSKLVEKRKELQKKCRKEIYYDDYGKK